MKRKVIMSSVRHIRQVADYIRYVGGEEQHPLVGVVSFDELPEVRHSLNNYDVYGFFLHEQNEVELSLGISKYHYTSDSIICVQPGLTGGKPDDGTTVKLTGWALLFHPALLSGTPLERNISQYGFYTYPQNEALSLDVYERNIIVSIIKGIRVELEANNRDKDWQHIVVSYIELILNYCQRAYNRQYHVHPSANSNDRLSELFMLLKKYYDDGMQEEHGLPTVTYCAQQMHITANYLGDLVKQGTGSSALSYIHRFVISKAKSLLLNGYSISETAYKLGFDYPQHMSRMFKKSEGLSPTEFVESLGETS